MNQHQLHAQDQILVHLYSPCFPSNIGATKIKCELTQKCFFCCKNSVAQKSLKLKGCIPYSEVN